MRGKIYIVGFGPGKKDYMTFQAYKVIEKSDIVVGYTAYVDILKEEFKDKEFLSTPMKKEVDRCKIALEEALKGKTVAMVSSGDSGIYGMAGIMLQTVHLSKEEVEVEVVSGVTAISAAAALLGAPITHDFAVISLSDLLTPLDLIFKRVECAAQGDFVVGLYNPKSMKRADYLEKSIDIMLKYKSKDTPVGIGRNCGRVDESAKVTTLEKLKEEYVDMFTVIIVGNSNTYIEKGKMITPRGYSLK